MRMDLRALMQPRSIAVLGASEKPSVGRAILDSLVRMGFQGDVFPVNPAYADVLGFKCYPGLSDLPAPPDVVAFCIGNAGLMDSLERGIERGMGAAVVYTAGFAERDEEGRKFQERIAAMSREGGVALCGPNCMGVLSPHHRSTTYLQEVRDPARLKGHVGLLSQSGSICIAIAADVRRFGFSHVLSTGNEAVVTTADIVEYLVDDADTHVIAAFLESVREPERFVSLLDRAAAAGKPVVILKVGRTQRSQRAITSHTGGLAGESRVFSEVLRAHRAIEVADLDEFTEVLGALQGTRRPAGSRIGVVTSSGGKAELMLDVAASCGLELPPLAEGARAELERAIGAVSGDGNPLDAWGNGDYANNFPLALKALSDSPDHDVVVLSTDVADDDPMGHPERGLRYGRLLVEAAKASSKPHVMLGMRPSVMQQAQIDQLREHGIPVVGGTRQGLGAIAKIGRWSQPLAPARSLAAISSGALATELARRPQRKTINEHDAKRLLAAAGLQVAREALTRSLDEACAAAETMGYPVVLKLLSDDLPHKSEFGLVKVGMRSKEGVVAAWRALDQARAAIPANAAIDGILVQELVGGGIEVMAGVSRDPEFGPVLAFGLGGVAVEVLRDFALRLLPLRQGDAATMIGEIQAAPLLRGARARVPYDIDALVHFLEGFADFAWAEQAHIREIDLNPIMVLERGRGCRIVDALIIPRHETESDA